MIDAIAFKFQTGTQWVHLPERYGNWRGDYNRLRMWAVDGTWEHVFTGLMAEAEPRETSTGRCRWTRQSCALTSTRPGPVKMGSDRRTW